MVKLPKSFIEEGYKFEAAIPTAKLETERTPEGSFVLRACYETNEIEELAQEVAIEMTDKIEAAIMDELLRMNGYVPERTCEFDSQACGKRRCKRCGAFVSVGSVCDCFGCIPVKYCPNCGAKVVQE